MISTQSPTGFQDPGTLVLATEVADDTATVCLGGELDLATAPSLGDALATVQGPHVTTLVLDLSQVVFIDSTGLHQLVVAMKRQRAIGGDVVLRSPGPRTLRVLDIVGLTQVFTIV